MRSLFTALTLSVITLSAIALPASAATKQEVEGFVDRLKSGDLDENVLLYATADRRVAFAHINAWMPTRPLFPSENPYALTTEIDRDLERVSYQVGGETFTVGDFLKREPLMGMAVVKGDTIKLEHYAKDHSPESVWVSFSVTKSFTSTL
ncbi:MAG: serine hydrolase, partial [Luminiphilus sp.]